ncbi:MAG: hypothetical protein HYT87_02995 [Nitrospirae bacterium]|nr:hypothetical protein [Nitrospirota bacterium]
MGRRIQSLIGRVKTLHIPPLTIRNLAIFLGAGAVFALTSGWGLAKYARSPHNCLSCHSTGETSFVGGTSKVHPPYSEVRCVECHAMHLPKFPWQMADADDHMVFASRTERLNDNCLRCHKDIPNKKELKYEHNEKHIKMNHELHIKLEEMRCPDCHYTITHDHEAEPTNRPKMTACMGNGCHEQTKETCETCHPEDSIKPPLYEHLVRSDCGGCHLEYKETHKVDEHLPKGMVCRQCHSNKTEHGELIDMEEPPCLECHE